MAQCLSALGPPPHCGHTPSISEPICEKCQEAYDNYVLAERQRTTTNAIHWLESLGYTITPPAD